MDRPVQQEWFRSLSSQDRLVTVIIILLLLSLPARVNYEVAQINLERVTYGFHDWESEGDGTLFRWTTGRVAVFLSPDVRTVDISLRALPRPGAKQVDLSINVPECSSIAIRLSDGAWHRYRLQLPESNLGSSRRLEMIVDRTWFPSQTIPGNSDDRELGVKVGLINSHRRVYDPNFRLHLCAEQEINLFDWEVP